MAPPSAPARFFIHAAIALGLMFLVTLRIQPGAQLVPALRAIQAGIVFGLVLAATKLLLRHFKIGWPSSSRRTFQKDDDRPV